MPATNTPLRYPGGKTQLYSYVKNILEYNSMQKYTYVEPFAGGAGLALKLLYNNVVPRIIINDFDPAIYAFWYSCLHSPNELKTLINSAQLTTEEWDNQKSIYRSQNGHSLLELGFATLFLNRTNISGIVTGGILGGKKQTGSSKMDARFNKKALCTKIDDVFAHRDAISLYNLDASDLILDRTILENNCFLNIDPPYVSKGAQLYRNHYNEHDHLKLSKIVAKCSHPWIVTYDICDLVKDAYCNCRTSKLDVRYCANIKRTANEYIFFSDNLLIPENIKLI